MTAPLPPDGALCAQVDPELFFPVAGESNRDAKRICARCDVREECLELVLWDPDASGIWGGTSPKERMAMRRGAA